MLKNFDDIFTLESMADVVLEDALAQLRIQNYLRWKAGWVQSLQSKGWLCTPDVPRKIRRKMFRGTGVSEKSIDLCHLADRHFITLLDDGFCPCCLVATMDLRRQGRDAVAVVLAHQSPGVYHRRADGALIGCLDFEQQVWCFAAKAVVDYEGNPYQTRDNDNLAESKLYPSTEVEVLKLFAK